MCTALFLNPVTKYQEQAQSTCSYLALLDCCEGVSFSKYDEK